MTRSRPPKPALGIPGKGPGRALVEAVDLHKSFPLGGGLLSRTRARVRAVQGVSFTIPSGRIVGLVGESGSGKTTVGRLLLRLIKPSSGLVRFEGTDLSGLDRGRLKRFRKRMQIIFQDPFASLNPRLNILDNVGEPLTIHNLARGRARRERVARLLERVGISPERMLRHPHEFSGGQRQRLVIARSLALEPEFIIADEPVSALDVSVQAQIVNLLLDLKQDLGLTILFISHDLGLVRHIADQVMVIYLGRLMETGPARKVYDDPCHPYTKALLSAVPIPEPGLKRKRTLLSGSPSSPIDPPLGCVFHPRCPEAKKECALSVPELREVLPGHFLACPG